MWFKIVLVCWTNNWWLSIHSSSGNDDGISTLLWVLALSMIYTKVHIVFVQTMQLQLDHSIWDNVKVKNMHKPTLNMNWRCMETIMLILHRCCVMMMVVTGLISYKVLCKWTIQNWYAKGNPRTVFRCLYLYLRKQWSLFGIGCFCSKGISTNQGVSTWTFSS